MIKKSLYRLYGLTLFFFLASYAFLGSAPPDESTKPHLVIDYVSTVRGYIETCGCHSGNFGGIARRATYLKQLRSENLNLLALCNGDLNAGSSTQDQLK